MEKAKLLSIFIFFLLVLPLANALYITNDPISTFKYDTAARTAEVTFSFRSSLNTENGLFELQMRPYTGQSVFYGGQSPCEPYVTGGTYSDKISYSTTQLGDTGTRTIKMINIPVGSYTPFLIHYSACCKKADGSPNPCQALQPIGDGIALSGKITFTGTTSGGTSGSGTTTQPSVDFRLGNLKRIKFGTDEYKNAPTLVKLNVIGTGPNLDVYSYTIKNTGTASAGTKVEAYYVSKTNPFYNNIVNLIANVVPLQAVIAGQSGISQESATTCKGETGSVMGIATLAPNEEKTFYFNIAEPKRDDILADNNNYNPTGDGEYLLVLSAFDNCQNANIYDAIAGTKNFILDSSGNIVGDGGGSITDEEASGTAIDSKAKQVTVSKSDISILTSGDLSKSACAENNMCQDDAVCQSVQSLIDEGVISETKAKEDVQGIKSRLRFLVDTGGVVSGAVGAGLIGTKAGLAICTAFGAGTSGIGFPVCLGVLSLGGAIIGGTLADTTFKLFDSIDKEDLKVVGYCVPEEGVTSGFKGFLDSVGKSINGLFGGTQKTKIGNFALGILVIAVLGAFLLFGGRK